MRFAAIGARRRRKKELYRRVSGTDNCVPSRPCLVLSCLVLRVVKASKIQDVFMSDVRPSAAWLGMHTRQICTLQAAAKHHTSCSCPRSTSSPMARWRDILLVLGPRKPIDSHFSPATGSSTFTIIASSRRGSTNATTPATPARRKSPAPSGRCGLPCFQLDLPCSVYLGFAARRDRGQSYHRPIAFESWMGKDGIDFVGV
jgi:hypothetical protein